MIHVIAILFQGRLFHGHQYAAVNHFLLSGVQAQCNDTEMLRRAPLLPLRLRLVRKIKTK